MLGALFDSCILIDHLRGVPEAQTELGRFPRCAISAITWIEVMAGAPDPQLESTRSFLSRFELIPLDSDVSERALNIRRNRRIRLPEAIIQASAESRGLLLVTRNVKDFPADLPGIRLPYTL